MWGDGGYRGRIRLAWLRAFARDGVFVGAPSYLRSSLSRAGILLFVFVFTFIFVVGVWKCVPGFRSPHRANEPNSLATGDELRGYLHALTSSVSHSVASLSYPLSSLKIFNTMPTSLVGGERLCDGHWQ